MDEQPDSTKDDLGPLPTGEERLPADRPRASVVGGNVAQKATTLDITDLFQKLRQLWKGTLYTVIYGLYVLLIGAMFVFVDWRAALLSFFVIAVSHPLRFIVNSVDKIGWEIVTKKVQGDTTEVKTYQQRLFWGLFAAIQVCNLFLVGQVWFVTNVHWYALGVLAALVLIEFLFGQIQAINKKIEFTWADYGQS